MDPQVSAVAELLREKGHRLTPQRMMVLEVIVNCGGHICVEHIFEQLVARYPFAHKSTVYRTVELLHQMGVVTQTDLGEGRVQFELAQRGKHHHIVCERCGRVEVLDDDLFTPVRSALLDRYGFTADLEHFAIFGRCRDCVEQPETGNGISLGRAGPEEGTSGAPGQRH